jgi:prefoldin subunit 5
MVPEQELTWLKDQSQAMQEQLDQINARITELTTKQATEK